MTDLDAATAALAATRIRWWIAGRMNRLRGQCWADLVAFALRDRRSPWQPVSWMCRSDLASAGVCYCGKLREDSDD